MSAEDIKDAAVMAANQDTPTNVIIPRSWVGVIAWVVGRVGPTAALAIIVAVYFGRDREEMYRDMKTQQADMMVAFTARTTVETEHISLLKSMQLTLGKIDEKLDREKRQPQP